MLESLYKSDLYIIAAGIGSRMGGDIPKALVQLTDTPNITTTLKQSSGKFKNVYIVINEENNTQIQWNNWMEITSEMFPDLVRNVQLVPIKSGLGDGHAVLEAIYKIENLTDSLEDIVICWGDVFFPYSETFDEILSCKDLQQFSNKETTMVGIMPVVYEPHPYVTIDIDGDVVKGAYFSKWNEHPPGDENTLKPHDQSIFRFNRALIKEALEQIHNATFRNGTYASHGELSLLFSFHYTFNAGKGTIFHYTSNYPTMSFNTPAEVQYIQRQIDERWNDKFK